jgi:hypothetical protein
MCDPAAGKNCGDGEVCDISVTPNTCISQDLADRRLENSEKLFTRDFNGKMVIGTKKAIEALTQKVEGKKPKAKLPEPLVPEPPKKPKPSTPPPEIPQPPKKPKEGTPVPEPGDIEDILKKVTEEGPTNVKEISDIQQKIFQCLGIVA